MTDERNPQEHARELAEKLYASIPRPAFDPKLSKELAEYLDRELVRNTAIKTFTALIAPHTASQLAGAVPQGYTRGFRDGFMAGSKNKLKIIWDKWSEKGMDQVLFTAWLGRGLEAGSPPADPESTEQTHQPGAVPQAEADALIAGAVAEVSKKISVHWLFEIKCSHGEQTDVAICACGLWQSAPQPTVGDAVERWVEHALDGLTTDAARLALEERLRAERLKISQSCIDVAVSCRAEDVAQRLRAIVDDDRAWLAEREAKLIADTRLEESKFWWNVHRSLSHEGVSNCSMCEHHRANRAAVQGGASRDDS